MRARFLEFLPFVTTFTYPKSVHLRRKAWALPDKHVYMAVGAFRQMIMIFPELDVVAVTTVQVDDFSSSEFAGLVSRAVKSAMSLPADEVSAKLLANKILDVATEKATEVGPTSKIAADVSGKVYKFAPNQVNLKSFSLILNDPKPHYDIEIYNRGTTKILVRFYRADRTRRIVSEGRTDLPWF
jgi:3-phosphoglycerate kinase